MCHFLNNWCFNFNKIHCNLILKNITKTCLSVFVNIVFVSTYCNYCKKLFLNK